MKKVFILVLAAMCAASAAYGQQSKQNVAVYVNGSGDAGMNKVLGAKLVSEIVRSGNYLAIERTDDFLRGLQKEQSYQRSGNVDDNQICELGKEFGAQFVCVADITSVMDSKFLQSRLIDIETAMVIATADYMENIQTADDIVKAAETVASQLLSTLTGGSYATIYIYRPKEGKNFWTQENAGLAPYMIKINGNAIASLESKGKTAIKVRRQGNCAIAMEAEIPAHTYESGSAYGGGSELAKVASAIISKPVVVPARTINQMLSIDIEFGKEYYICVKKDKIVLMDAKKGKKEFDKIK